MNFDFFEFEAIYVVVEAFPCRKEHIDAHPGLVGLRDWEDRICSEIG